MAVLLNDGVFWSGIAVLLISGYKFTVQYCLKSRCENFNCLWGLLKIKRDIKSEVEIEKIQIEMGNNTKNEDDTVVENKMDDIV